MQTLVNTMNTDPVKQNDEKVKRKGMEHLSARPKKIMRMDEGNALRPATQTTISRLVIPKSKLDEPTTPIRKAVSTNTVQPTPARDILRHKVDSDEEEDPSDSPPMIARPPTPPRAHINLTEDIPMEVDSISPKRPLTPENDGSPRLLKMRSTTRLLPPRSPVSRLTVPRSTQTMLSPASATPRKAMGGISRFRSPAPPPQKVKGSEEGMKQMTLSGFSGFGLSRSSGRMSLVDNGAGEENREEEVRAVARAPFSAIQDSGVAGETERAVENEDVDMGAEEVVIEETGLQETAILAQNKPAQVNAPEIPDVAPAPYDTISEHTTKPLPTISSMPPPSRIPTMSRIPRRTIITPSETASSNTADQAGIPLTTLPKRSMIPPRRPTTSTLGRGFPSVAPNPTADSIPRATTPNPAPTKRKPSYPTSLGSGPLARPRARMVSGPVTRRIQDSSSDLPQPRPSSRSVSAPYSRTIAETPISRLSASTSRREGLSLETSKSIAGLSEALLKLKMKKIDLSAAGSSDTRRESMIPRAPTPSYSKAQSEDLEESGSRSTANLSRLSSVHRPRQSLAALASGPSETTGDMGEAGDRSLAALVVSETGQGIMKGVIAFVDVKTSDGDDVSPLFSGMLRSLGAKVRLAISAFSHEEAHETIRY
jgi:hypothetical protein